MKHWLLRGMAMAMSTMFAVSALPQTAMVSLAANAATPAAVSNDRNVMLGVSGLSDPANPFGDDWLGNFVYFGNIGNYPICFRVLDTDGKDSVLLDSNYGVIRKVYDADGNGSYSDSDIRTYLNSEFYEGNFSQTERNAINAANGAGLNGDKVFLLSADDVKNGDYGYSEGPALFKENMKVDMNLVPWMLRSEDGQMSYVDASGAISSGDPTGLTYITPAVNVSKENVAFTYPADAAKPTWMAPTYDADDAYLKMTLTGGSGFSAQRKSGDNSPVPAGYGFLVDVKDVGTANTGVNYSQISGLLKDKDGNVAAYGLLSDVAATGEVLATIPSTVPAGDYTMYVFAEDVESGHYDHATDYASNFAAIPVKVTDAGMVDSETQTSAESSQKKNSDKAEAKKTDTKAAEAAKKADTPAKQQKQDKKDQPQAVAHTVKVSNDGNGTATVSVDKAKAGTVVTLLALPNSGYHFKEWQSAEVKVANDNRFTMPDRDVTVKAVFEKNNDKHAIIFDRIENGTVTVNTTSAYPNEEIRIKANPVGGYHFQKWETEGLGYNLDAKDEITFRMPNGDVKIKAIFEKDERKKYDVTIKATGGGRAWADVSREYPNNWVLLTASPDSGYRFVRWESSQVNPGGQNKFLMPKKDVTVTAVFEKIPESNYAVSTVARGEGGRMWITDEKGNSRSAFKKGEKVVIHTDLEKNVKIESMRAENVDLTIDSKSGDRYFFMPAKDVTVTVVFSKEKQPETYSVSSSVSGTGTAYVGDDKGNPKNTFNQGDTVWVWWEGQAGIDKVETNTGERISQDTATGAYTFTMPGKNVTLYVRFKDPEPIQFSVNVTSEGNGSAWLAENNKTSGKYKEGDTVTLNWFSNESELESITATGVEISYSKDKDSTTFKMPATSVSVRVKFKEAAPVPPTPPPVQKYTVRINTQGNGSAWLEDNNGSSAQFEPGQSVKFNWFSNEAQFDSISGSGVSDFVYGSGGESAGFLMPANDVTITVKFKAVAQNHSVTVSANGNAWSTDMAGNPMRSFKAGETVQIVYGSEMQAPTSVTASGATVTQSGQYYTFTMPDADVVVNVVFPERQPDPVPVPAVVDEGDTNYTNFDDFEYHPDDDIDDDFDEGGEGGEGGEESNG